ncbi:MAG: hypothetical protein DI535_07485 [Citrobacter freundii]|nr:MAG: hypothetical protein DI535_07485 [Citrobacter freundii]
MEADTQIFFREFRELGVESGKFVQKTGRFVVWYCALYFMGLCLVFDQGSPLNLSAAAEDLPPPEIREVKLY